MRYEDWDILIFPRGSKTPVREFKTACHVVPDTECAFAHGSYGLPTLTCFVPSLPSGTPFTISLHSWTNPEMSQFTKSFSQHHDSASFDVRIFLDGRLVATRPLAREGPWPQTFEHSFDFTKNGSFDFLKFPPFRSELLRQSHWNPSDELGRIRVIISEGYPRDSATVPIERVKNIMAFSFQHAPIDILETASIAWPNPGMWRRAMISPTISARTFSHAEASDIHTHSPRFIPGYGRSSGSLSHQSNCQSMTPNLMSTNTSDLLRTMPCTEALLQHTIGLPTNLETDYFRCHNTDGAASSGWAEGQVPAQIEGEAFSSNDRFFHSKPMPRHSLTQNRTTQPAPNMTPNTEISADIVALSGPPQEQQELQANEAPDTLPRRMPNVPTNTPTERVNTPFLDELFVDGSGEIIGDTSQKFDCHNQLPAELATTLTQSLLNQPMPLPVVSNQAQQPVGEVKSRKENRTFSLGSTGNTPNLTHNDMRKVSQSALSNFCMSSTDSAGATSSNSSRAASGACSDASSNQDEQTRSTTTSRFALLPVGEKVLNLDKPTNIKTPSSGTGDKGIKRTRHFTPASVRAIDEEDEPRRPSPQNRIASSNEEP